MIVRRDQAVAETREKMRGGAGTIRIIQHIPAAAMHGKCRLAATLELPPGAGIGFHEHKDEYEIYIVQKGTGELDDNGTRLTVGPGDAVLTGGGEGHAIRNTGGVTMEITAVILT